MQRQVSKREQKTKTYGLDLGLTPLKNGTLHNPFGPNFGQSDYNMTTLQNFNKINQQKEGKSP